MLAAIGASESCRLELAFRRTAEMRGDHHRRAAFERV